MFIRSAAAIGHQPSFRNPGFSAGLEPLLPDSKVQEPDYREMISAAQRRRLSPVLKMALAASLDCLTQAEVEQPDGIIVGSGLGSSTHTQKFLDKIAQTPQGGLLSPTSFILSTHNTIAGQISLALKNPHYNTTYTHHSLSFEQGLIDAMMCLEEGAAHILVGGADEGPNVLYNLEARLHNPSIQTACGAAFFVLSKQARADDVQLLACESHSRIQTPERRIQDALQSHNLDAAAIPLILYASQDAAFPEGLQNRFPGSQFVDYTALVGTYLTSSAFALAYAVDYLQQELTEQGPVLICNHLLPHHLGLMLVAPYSESA